MTTDRLLDLVLVDLSWVVLAYFVLVNGVYLVLLVAAAFEMRRYVLEVRGRSRHGLLTSEFTPRVSVLVPAHDEEATIVESVHGLLTLSYPDVEVVVVDDGSTDRTIEVLSEAFALVAVPVDPVAHLATEEITAMYRSPTASGLVVASKRNGGKADALNAAVNLASGELVCALDADTIVENDALQRLVRPFLRSPDVVAAGATIRVVNASRVEHGRLVEVRVPRSPLAGIQAVEYLRAFLFGRLGWNRLGGNLVISGAFGLFRRDALQGVGGYHHGVGEDIELIVRLRRSGYESASPSQVEFVPDPVAWTEVPSSLTILGRQRDRWHRGLADTMWRHRDVLFRPRYGALGSFCAPVFVLVELLAPVVEAVGLVAMGVGLMTGRVDVDFAVLFLLLAYGLAIMLSVLALLLEELTFRRYGSTRERWWLVWWALAEHVGYRQLTVWWRLRGLVGFVRGDRTWGPMERSGFMTRGADTPDEAGADGSDRLNTAR